MDPNYEEPTEWQRVRQLERAADEMQRRLEALEVTVAGLDRTLRQLVESEDIGPTD